jgi:tetratricopeptide (TPR) repeat protein
MSATGLCNMRAFVPGIAYRFRFQHRFQGRRQQVTRLVLLAAIFISSVLIATAQMNNNPGRMPQRGPASLLQLEVVVSKNELQAPEGARNALHQGREAMERGRYREANRRFARALEIYPKYALALELRGILNMGEGRLDEACSDLQQAIEYDPNLGGAYLALGAAYNRLLRFSQAVAPLTRAAMMLPDFWMVHYEIALAFLGSGKYEAALEAISQAIEKNPAEPENRSSVFYTKARVLQELNNNPGAQAAFEQSIRQDPQGHFAQLSEERLERLSAPGGEK